MADGNEPPCRSGRVDEGDRDLRRPRDAQAGEGSKVGSESETIGAWLSATGFGFEAASLPPAMYDGLAAAASFPARPQGRVARAGDGCGLADASVVSVDARHCKQRRAHRISARNIARAFKREESYTNQWLARQRTLDPSALRSANSRPNPFSVRSLGRKLPLFPRVVARRPVHSMSVRAIRASRIARSDRSRRSFSTSMARTAASASAALLRAADGSSAGPVLAGSARRSRRGAAIGW